MLIKIIQHIVLLLVLLVLQVAVVPALPSFLSNLNIILVVIVFVAVVYQFYWGAIYALILGFCLDLFSSLPFGAILIGYLITLYVIYKVFQYLLTNKSFYTLLGLTGIATLIYSFIIYLYSVLVYFVGTKDLDLIKSISLFSLQNSLWQLLFNLGLVIILFLFFHFSSKRFKAVFIDTVKG